MHTSDQRSIKKNQNFENNNKKNCIAKDYSFLFFDNIAHEGISIKENAIFMLISFAYIVLFYSFMIFLQKLDDGEYFHIYLYIHIQYCYL